MKRDLFGEEHPIVKRAREIARTRREPVKTVMRSIINGMVTEKIEEYRGYVVYRDLEDYFREEVKEVSGWQPRRVREKIKCILCEADWEYKRGKHRRAEFYEPI